MALIGFSRREVTTNDVVGDITVLHERTYLNNRPA